jgi:LacI family transcriptional regulator
MSAQSKPSYAPPHVALLVETSLASGRDILLGIARYVREHQPWLLYHKPRSLEESLPTWLSGWKGHGILARVQTRAMADALLATGLPVVDVLGVIDGTAFPVVRVDDAEVGRLAAQHLLERGFREFAYLGMAEENWSSFRQEAFGAEVAEAGFQVQYRIEPRHESEGQSWEKHQEELAEWVSKLPVPVGVMLCSDQLGTRFLDACRRAGRSVPYEVAVIGVDNDEPLCEVSNPPLSSVWPGHAQLGYDAAALLDRLMVRATLPAERRFVPPLKIVTRLSSDTIAVEDPAVARALRVIRERACHRIRLDDIAEVVGVSRSVLQRRFQSVLGRTINQELIHQRLKVAQSLLLETKLSLPEIAERAGFQHQEYMGAIFKAHLKRTPASFRLKSP